MAKFNEREDIVTQLQAFYQARFEAFRVKDYPYFVIDDGDLYPYHSAEDARLFCQHFGICPTQIEVNPHCATPKLSGLDL
jgi:hypothetical protein